MRRLLLAGLLLVGAAACSDDDDGSDATTTVDPGDVNTTVTTGADGTTTTAAEPTTTTAATEVGDPLEAAQAWLDLAFPGNTAVLGEFQQGDTRSGEVPVSRPNEGGGGANPASTLLLRLDDADEWQVIGAVSEFVTIEEPTTSLAPGATVSGIGRGFEGTLVVRAIGLDGTEHGLAVAQGGAQADPVAYAAELPLDGVEAGDEVYLVVNGGVGLEGDTGEFAALRLPVDAG